MYIYIYIERERDTYKAPLRAAPLPPQPPMRPPPPAPGPLPLCDGVAATLTRWPTSSPSSAHPGLDVHLWRPRAPSQRGDAVATKRYPMTDAHGRRRLLRGQLYPFSLNTFGALEPGGRALLDALRKLDNLGRPDFVQNVLAVQFARSQARRFLAGGVSSAPRAD